MRVVVPRYLVDETVGAVPETAAHGLSCVARLHERFDLLACSSRLLVQLLTCGIVDLPGGRRNGEAHVRKRVEGYAATNEDGGFEGKRLLRVFVVVMEDEGRYDGAAL